ncbi:MAG TPA: MASE3 domain-containing protein, partial [Spirochaetia bacterium]|nr:MASE3 domain-containing protein [Spirochaetia bacterium]
METTGSPTTSRFMLPPTPRDESSIVHPIRTALVILVSGVALYLLSRYRYLLFHSLAEIFSITIAAGVFVVAWNTRRYNAESSLFYIGAGYLCVAFLDVMHTISYAGMGVFPDDRFYANQIWIVSRATEALTLLVFLGIVRRRSRTTDRIVALTLPLVAAAAVFTIFVVPVFPACF